MGFSGFFEIAPTFCFRRCHEVGLPFFFFVVAAVVTIYHESENPLMGPEMSNLR